MVLDLEAVEDTYLYLIDGKRAYVAGRNVLDENDNYDSGADVELHSRISATLPTGTYTIEATTKNEETTGSFGLILKVSERDNSDITPTPTHTPNPTLPNTCAIKIAAEDITIYDILGSDCPSDNRAGSYARYYTFTLDTEADVTVALALDKDAYLFLTEGERLRRGRVLYENDDDATYGGLSANSRIDATLPVGTYTIEATTFAPGVMGAFTLSLKVRKGDTISPTPAPVACESAIAAENATIEGEWTGDCASDNRDGSYARYYTFTLDAEADVAIDLESNEDTYLYLIDGKRAYILGRNVLYENDNDSAGGDTETNSRIAAVLPAGTYTIEATTYKKDTRGKFDLILDLQEQDDLNTTPTPTPNPILPNTCAIKITAEDTTIYDTLVSDCPSDNRAGSYARYYTFTLDTEADVTVALASDEDAYLFLIEGERLANDSEVLYENDDDATYGGLSTNSRIDAALPVGTYTIEATTYAPGVTSAFALTLKVSDAEAVTEFTAAAALAPAPTPTVVPDPCLDFIAAEDADIGGSWSDACVSDSRGGSYARYYTFTLDTEAGVVIELASSYDAYLFLIEGERGAEGSEALYENDDDATYGGMSTNSRIDAALPAGTYTMEATTYRPGIVGNFTLTLTVSEVEAGQTE